MAQVSFIGPPAFFDLLEIIPPVVIRFSAHPDSVDHILAEKEDEIHQGSDSRYFLRQTSNNHGDSD